MSVNSQLNSISANFNHLKDKFIHVSKGANEHEKAIILKNRRGQDSLLSLLGSY